MFCERGEEGADLEETLVFLGPTLLSIGAGALSVWRRQLRFVLVAALVLLPLAFLLPSLVLS
jgi:hypothetical protein